MYHNIVDLCQNCQKVEEMRKIYVDANEEFPPNVLKSRGKGVQLNCFVELDHAGDRMTRRSQTGILIFGNLALFWYSKK